MLVCYLQSTTQALGGVDVQAHNASLRPQLRACRSAIIYCSKSQR